MCFSILDGGGKPNYTGDILSAAAKTTFLTAAEVKRAESDAMGEVKCADTFRAATLRGVQS